MRNQEKSNTNKQIKRLNSNPSITTKPKTKNFR